MPLLASQQMPRRAQLDTAAFSPSLRGPNAPAAGPAAAPDPTLGHSGIFRL